MDSPNYPVTDDTADARPAPTMGWGARIGIGVAVLALLLIIVLHLTGVVGGTS